jgi:hypothetical protein
LGARHRGVDFFDTPLVIEASPGQLTSDAFWGRTVATQTG